MLDIFKREFLVRVVLTLGLNALVESTKVCGSDLLGMCLGEKPISDGVLKSVYQALSEFS